MIPDRPVVPTIPARARAPRLGVTVVTELVDAIVRGDLPPGTTLPPESVLCEQFAVSRTVIRESIKRIEEKGLVTVAQGRGTQVAPVSAWKMADETVLAALVDNDATLGTLDDLSVVRAALEALIARDAAGNPSASDIARLGEALQLMRETISDQQAYGEADVIFHSIVGEMSTNRLADSIVKTLFTQARSSARFSRRTQFEITLVEHEAIFEAIATGDPEAAEQAMRRHILDAWERRRPPRPEELPSSD
jgi:DNA-binding FadR family transcriptional regulator